MPGRGGSKVYTAVVPGCAPARFSVQCTSPFRTRTAAAHDSNTVYSALTRFFVKKTCSLLAFSLSRYILNVVSSGASPSSRGLGHQVLILVTWVRIPLGMPFFCACFQIIQYLSFNNKRAWRFRRNQGTFHLGQTGSKAKKTHGFSRTRKSVLKKSGCPSRTRT